MSSPVVHIITDDAILASAGFEHRADMLLRLGGPRAALHLRGYATSASRLYTLARGLVVSARSVGARIVVHDRVDVARAADAHGVQLGVRSLPVSDVRSLWGAAWIGSSVHGVDEATQAGALGTDFLLLGTIYATPTHPGRTGAGVVLIEAVRARVTLPIIAIGGITPARVNEVRRAGAAGVALLGGIWSQDDPATALGAVLAAWDREGEASR